MQNGKAQLDQRELALLSSEMDQRGRSTLVTYICWLVLGFFGLHRFYLGHAKAKWYLITALIGIVACFILVGFIILFGLGIVVFIDLFRIPGWVDARNRAIEDEVVSGLLAARGADPGQTPVLATTSA